MLKRLLLFFATNLLVIITISIITNVLGLRSYLSAQGIDYQALLLFCLLWGMVGSIVSLLLSKVIAKFAMGVVVINPSMATRDERFLLEIVYLLAKKAGITKMPEVGIYHSPEANAFATGPSKNHSLVAVSSGLLTNMNRDEIEAVLGHEISHIANGDMVTMTLVQGIINSFALFLSRIIAYAVSLALSKGEEKTSEISYLTYSLLTIVFDILFTVLGSLLVSSFSRYREYRADLGGAKLAGKDKMIAALRRLQRTADFEDTRGASIAAFKISRQNNWLEVFSTHPSLDKRIARLQQMRL